MLDVVPGCAALLSCRAGEMHPIIISSKVGKGHEVAWPPLGGSCLLWPPWKSPMTLDEMVVETERGEGWISNLLFVLICGIIDLS